MANNNFQYLLRCYLSDRMTEEEWQEWRKMIEDERYETDIVLGIETCLLVFLSPETGKAEGEDRIWQNILVSIGKITPK